MCVCPRFLDQLIKGCNLTRLTAFRLLPSACSGKTSVLAHGLAVCQRFCIWNCWWILYTVKSYCWSPYWCWSTHREWMKYPCIITSRRIQDPTVSILEQCQQLIGSIHSNALQGFPSWNCPLSQYIKYRIINPTPILYVDGSKPIISIGDLTSIHQLFLSTLMYLGYRGFDKKK